MTEEQAHEELRAKVKATYGKPLKTTSDFKLLSQSIYDRANIMLSSTTLRRYYGQQELGRSGVRPSTLDILAQYAGYADWDTFCAQLMENTETESHLIYENKQLDVAQLQPGQQIRLMWQPDRVVKIQYEGEDRFRVTESCKSKLRVDDTFQCQLFIEGQPLILTNLTRPDMPTCNYICGGKRGIKFKTLE